MYLQGTTFFEAIWPVRNAREFSWRLPNGNSSWKKYEDQIYPPYNVMPSPEKSQNNVAKSEDAPTAVRSTDQSKSLQLSVSYMKNTRASARVKILSSKNLSLKGRLSMQLP